MGFSVVPLLIVDPELPPAARAALRQACALPEGTARTREKVIAAREIVARFGIDAAEARELVGLYGDVAA